MTARKGRIQFGQMLTQEQIEQVQKIAKQRGCKNIQELLRAVMIPWWLERYTKSLKLRMMIV